MKQFIQRFSEKVIGALSGFDRLVIRGILQPLVHIGGMRRFLWENHIYLTDFRNYVSSITEQLKEACYGIADKQGRPRHYLETGKIDKEQFARKIYAEKPTADGLIVLLTTLEVCNTFGLRSNRGLKKLELIAEQRKCLHAYFYLNHPEFGFINVRLQTWFPFHLQICLNGREWLARKMDKLGLRYQRIDNTFIEIENIQKVQNLMNKQLRINWPHVLNNIVQTVNPIHGKIFGNFPVHYYWSVYQSEWATDIMFRDRGLAEIYPGLVHHAITNFSARDVLRFLGRKTALGALPNEVVTDFKNRHEGIRVKHRSGKNSVKMYDKYGNLRVETTMNDPKPFKVLRPSENRSNSGQWKRLRKSVTDISRRAYVSQACNDRYLDAIAAADTSVTVGTLLKQISSPTTLNGKRIRALNPGSNTDLQLLEAISRGDFFIHGFRNRDLQEILFTTIADSPKENKSRSARVTRLLRILRAHNIVQKIPRTYRYTLTPRGRQITTAIIAAHKLTLEQLNNAAA